MRKKNVQKKKFYIGDIFRIIVLLIAFSVLLYPTVSNYLYEKNGARVISSYDENAVRLSESEKQAMLEVGHFEGTSLPVGGESSHTVLTGHRGLPSKLLFTDLDQMKEGDIFYLKILGETFAYKIDQILTVLPENTKALTIEPGKDYATLVTCTPYAVNTHRLLVRGSRIPYEEAVRQVPDEKITPTLPFQVKVLLAAIGVLVLIFIVYQLWKKTRKRKEMRRKRK